MRNRFVGCMIAMAALAVLSLFTRPWKIRLPLRRVRTDGGDDPYANETWENACYEGNKAGEHMRDLGFQWFSGVVPPK